MASRLAARKVERILSDVGGQGVSRLHDQATLNLHNSFWVFKGIVDSGVLDQSSNTCRLSILIFISLTSLWRGNHRSNAPNDDMGVNLKSKGERGDSSECTRKRFLILAPSAVLPNSDGRAIRTVFAPASSSASIRPQFEPLWGWSAGWHCRMANVVAKWVPYFPPIELGRSGQIVST